MAQRQILVLGDSHTQALKAACEKRRPENKRVRFSVCEFSRTKNGVELGDTSVQSSLKMVSALSGEDILVSAIGGNQHNVLGLIQHPTPFDMFDGAEQAATPQQSIACIPYHALWDLFETRLRARNGPRFAELQRAAK